MMSETNNDKTGTPNFQGGAYDFKNKQEKEETTEAFGDPGVSAGQKEPVVGHDSDDKERREGYDQHRNKEPQTHEYARSMNRGRDVEQDHKSKPEDPRNQQVPYAPHDDRGESKESPSAREPEDDHK
jgi:hypothetical protein